MYFGLLLAATTALLGQPDSTIRWETTQVAMDAAPGAERVEVEFGFVNVGKERLAILDLRADCDCTSAAPSKWTFEAGETGVIRAALVNENGQAGRHRKNILVRTSAQPETEVILSLDITIPSAISVEPSVLLWEPANQSAPHTFLVSIHPKVRAEISSVSSDWPELNVTLQTIEAGKLYRLAPQLPTPVQTRSVTIKIVATTGTRELSQFATLILRK